HTEALCSLGVGAAAETGDQCADRVVDHGNKPWSNSSSDYETPTCSICRFHDRFVTQCVAHTLLDSPSISRLRGCPDAPPVSSVFIPVSHFAFSLNVAVLRSTTRASILNRHS